MSPLAAEESKKCIFKCKEMNIDDDAGHMFETPEPTRPKLPKIRKKKLLRLIPNSNFGKTVKPSKKKLCSGFVKFQVYVKKKQYIE